MSHHYSGPDFEFKYVATILVAILLSAPLVAGITFPASFHTQMVPTNGTSLYVRVGGKGPAVVLFAWLRRYG